MAKRTSDSQELGTTVEVMKALGGVKGVSALTGSQYSATENWSRKPTFPSRYFLVMTFALHRKGLSAPPELWGQVTPAERQEALTALHKKQAAVVAALKQKVAA